MTLVESEQERALDELQQRLGYRFHDVELLRTALRHGSYLHEAREEGQESNERLEFLGDAVLGMVVSHDLYRSSPGSTEGELTLLRSRLVRREVLAAAAKILALGRFLQLGRGEEETGGREKPSNLANAYEALIGALFLDGGFRIAWRFVHRHLLRKAEDLASYHQLENFKGHLLQLCQGAGLGLPEYRTEEENRGEFRSEVLVDGKLWGFGRGRNKKMAEQAAAQMALLKRADDVWGSQTLPPHCEGEQ